MSLEASTWAWSATGITSSERLVLLCLADHHNGKTGRCDPSIHTIIERTVLSEKTVQRALTALKKAGFLTVERQIGKRSVYGLQIAPSEPTPVTMTGASPCRPRHHGLPPPSSRRATPVIVTGEPESNRKEPGAGEAAASPADTGLQTEPKKQLFDRGLDYLAGVLGKPRHKVRPFMGKLLDEANGDAERVSAAIEQAANKRPRKPEAWLLKAVKPGSGAAQKRLPESFAELPSIVGGYIVAAVLDRVLEELDVGDLRFPHLPQEIVALLSEGYEPDELYAAACVLRARGAVKDMNSAAYFAATVRNRARDRSTPQRELFKEAAPI